MQVCEEGTHIGRFVTLAGVLLALIGSAPAVAVVPDAPSIVSVQGRQLVVERRNADGTLSAPAPYVMRGVVWSPASRGTNTTTGDRNNATIRRPEFCAHYEVDLPLIGAMNANTVRTPLDFGPELADCRGGVDILDDLYERGIMVVMTVDDAINDLVRVEQVVNAYKDHPAILAWSLGSEWNLNLYFTVASSVQDGAQRTEAAAVLIKSLDANHPVVSSYGDISIDGEGLRLADTARYVNTVAPSVDIWSVNAFRGRGFGDLFSQWASISGKPMFFGEFGTDAFRTTAAFPVVGAVDETMQADWNVSLWTDLFFELSALNPARVAIGGNVFAFNDEWWKVTPAGSQQSAGFVLASGHPDGFANEEYFGLVDIDRKPRAAYAAMQVAFRPDFRPTSTQIDFQALPDTIRTNIPSFFVSGRASPDAGVTVGGAAVPVDDAGNFVTVVALAVGDNAIRLVTNSPTEGTRVIVKTIVLDPSFSTAGRRLVYVDTVSPQLDGTVVIDVDEQIYLGILEGRHARGLSADERHLYVADRGVIDVGTHRELAAPHSPLGFSAEIPANGFVVHPDGELLYSREEILRRDTNAVVGTLAIGIETGTAFGGRVPGGPAIAADGTTLYCCASASQVTRVNPASGVASATGIGFVRTFQSDLSVSPDGEQLARSTYGGSFTYGLGLYDTSTLALRGVASIPGDFAGEVVFSRDGSRAIVGAAGNPAHGGGGVSVVDTRTFDVLSRTVMNLADNVAISADDTVFASSGAGLGVDAFALRSDGRLLRQASYFLGINRFVSTSGAPAHDQIVRVIVRDLIDTDGDGLSDAREAELGTDPRSSDTDGDGIPDGVEVGLLGIDADPTRTTEPTVADTDGDGTPDGGTAPACEDCNRNGRVDPGESDPNAVDIVLRPGLNLVAFPGVTTAETATCRDWLATLRVHGDVVSIARYDAQVGRFVRCDLVSETNFAITGGEGYLIEASEDVTASVPGSGVCGPALEPAGLHLRGFGRTAALTSCFRVLNALGVDVRSVSKLDAVSGRHLTCARRKEDPQGAPLGEDFELTTAEAVFVSAGAGGVPGCGTP